MSDIFISYEKSDLQKAKMLAQRLGSQGWATFWDRKIPAGSTWRKTIGKELDEARCVVVLWSKASIESGWVQEEADDAKHRGILVPVLIENIQSPIGFRSIQAGNLANWEGSESAEAFEGLITDITALIGSPPKLARQQGKPPAVETERQNKPLRGDSKTKPTPEARRKVVEQVEPGPKEEQRARMPAQPPPSSPVPRLAAVEQGQQIQNERGKQAERVPRRKMFEPRFVAKFTKNKPKRDKENCYEISFGVLGYPSGTRQIVFFTDHPDSLEEGTSLQEALCTVVIVMPQQRRVFVNEDEAWDIDGDFRLYAVGVFGDGRTFTLSTMLCDALDAHYSAEFPKGVPKRFTEAISDLRATRE
jgi:TIR domain